MINDGAEGAGKAHVHRIVQIAFHITCNAVEIHAVVEQVALGNGPFHPSQDGLARCGHINIFPLPHLGILSNDKPEHFAGVVAHHIADLRF